MFQAVTVTLNPAIDRTVTIPEFTAGAVNRVQDERFCAGGKGVNVASALADHGFQVAATGFLGCDNSVIFESLFARKRISDRFIRIAGQTRTGIKITDPVRRQTTDINFPGESPSAEDGDRLIRELDQLDSTWVVLAGSLPPSISPAIYRDLTAKLRQRGTKIALDASGEAFRLALPAGPHIVKPNIHELEDYAGRPLRDRSAVVGAGRELLRYGVELAIVSMGSEGALFITKDRVVTAIPPVFEVGSTVGAGDAMVAGIVAAGLRSLPLDASAQLATAFSVETLRRLTPGAISSQAVTQTMREVQIHQLIP